MRALQVLNAVIAVVVVGASPLATAPSALAHHSFAAQFDASRPVTLEGTVTKVEWQNPHIWVYLDVAGPDGESVAWECEGDNPNTLTRLGWTSESVQVGKPITIYGYQARSGDAICNGRTWVFGGQTVFAAANDGGPPAAPPEQR